MEQEKTNMISIFKNCVYWYIKRCTLYNEDITKNSS